MSDARAPEPVEYRQPRAEVVLEVEATPIERMRKQAVVGGFTIVADEPLRAGGDEAHPSPLNYLAAALSLCLLHQVQRSAALHKVPIEGVRAVVSLSFSTSGAVLAHTIAARCTGVRTTLHIESSADEETLAAVIADAERACYVNQALQQPVPSELEVILNRDRALPIPV